MPPQWTKRPVEDLTPRQREAYERRVEVIAAAAEVLMRERGAGVTMAEVAEAAGIGMSSVYRTFASKDELLAELARRRVERWAEIWHEAEQKEDPRSALVDAIWAFVGMDRGEQELADAIRTWVLTHRDDFLAVARLGEEVVERARSAGLRPDVDHDDVIRASELMAALNRSGAPGAWRRVLTIYIDGLFTPGAEPLPAVE
jgi:AcrR family transcriptional regulator